MDTVIMDNMTKQIIEYTGREFGKFLNPGDCIILHDTRYKICSKTLDMRHNKWVLTIDAFDVKEEEGI